MAQPFTATWRITWPYLVAGVAHKLRQYVNSDGSVVAGVIQIFDRNLTPFNWTAAAQQMVDQLSNNMLDQSTSYGAALLENRTGSLWNLMATATVSPSGSLAGVKSATQYTIVLRDSLFNKMKVILLDAAWPAPAHYTVPTGGADAHERSFMAALAAAGSNIPFDFIVSRSGHYVAASGGFVGSTIALNRKVRRRRGLT